VEQVIVELAGGYMLFMSVSDGSALAVLATKECDVGVVGYEMQMLALRMGSVLTPALITELQQNLSRI
jgi:uncharacterized protein